MSKDFNDRVTKGVAWMMLARLAVRVLGLLSTLVLARLLAPADFGLVAMATAIAAGLELLTMFSFETALIQQRQISRAHYDTSWTLNLLMGLGLAAALAIAAQPAAHFYREPRLVTVMLLLGFKYVLDSAGNPGTVDFRRRLEFYGDFVLQVVPKLAAILVTIPIAYWLRDYRALLAGMLLGSCASCVLSYIVHTYRPRWCLSEARGLFRFSRWLLLNNFVVFVRNRSADLIIGRALGPVSLGSYSIAYEISNLPSTEMVAPINRVLFPSYVQLAEDPERLREGFRTTLGMIALVILPISIALAALAEPLVHIVLGEKWLGTIPLVAVLAIAGGTSVLQSNTGSVYGALGRPHMVALIGGLQGALLIPILLYATYEYGVMGAAWGMLVHGVAVSLPSTYIIFLSTTPIRLGDVLRVCARPVAGCVSLFFAADMVLDLMDPVTGAGDAVLTLIAGATVGAATYLASVLLLWRAAGCPPGAERSLLDRARLRLRGEAAA